jgi:hypothetical protein
MFAHRTKGADGTTINKYYINQMVKDAENKSSLKFLHLSEARYGHCHNIWSSCGTEPFAVTMAAVKVKLATGTLTLQEHKAKFARKGEVSSLCPMCKQETENTAHFILQCASLQEVRRFCRWINYQIMGRVQTVLFRDFVQF